MLEKIKILEREISLLQNESETKEKALVVKTFIYLCKGHQIESSAYQDLCVDRDGSRGDINKAMYTAQIKEGRILKGCIYM